MRINLFYIIRVFILWGLLFSTHGFAATVAEAPDNSRVFAYAEANYPNIFTGAGTAGQYQQYLYRYYPASANYLGIDPAGELFILGPYSGHVLSEVGPIRAYANAITAWEATLEPITDKRVFAPTCRVFSWARQRKGSISNTTTAIIRRAAII